MLTPFPSSLWLKTIKHSQEQPYFQPYSNKKTTFKQSKNDGFYQHVRKKNSEGVESG
jgi:hypothetical protein